MPAMSSLLATAPIAVAFRPAASRRQQRVTLPKPLASANGSAPAGADTFQLTLRKPLGLVLAERKAGADAVQVVVEEVVPGGNAAKDGRVREGDVLTKCSAVLLKAGKEGEYEREGYGQRPYDNWDQVMFDCEGKKFDTVMAALGSNSERWGIFNVTLEFKRQHQQQQQQQADGTGA